MHSAEPFGWRTVTQARGRGGGGGGGGGRGGGVGGGGGESEGAVGYRLQLSCHTYVGEREELVVRTLYVLLSDCILRRT